MKYRLSLHLLSVALTVAFLAVTTQSASAKSWFFSGDTNLCSKCPEGANALEVRGAPLLSFNHQDQAFSGTVGGGLTVIENSRFDFMPRITLNENFGSSNSFTTTTKSTGDLSISANRNSQTLRFTDGRGPNGVISMPEPATLLLLGTGLSGLAAAIWKRRRIAKNSH